METVRLAELCAATSLITDMGTGQPAAHGLRTCLVAMRLADGLDLDSDARGELFYVSLLRFLGCTADAHHVAAMSGDEVQFLSTMAPVTMGSPGEEIRQMIRLLAGDRPVPARLKALARVLADPKGKQRLLGAHCEIAARLAVEMGLPGRVAGALEMAYARWDGRGVPADVGEKDIPISVRVSIVARDLELWAREAGDKAARWTLTRRRGRAYDPHVVDAALEVGLDELRRDDAEDLWERVLAWEPEPRATIVGEALDRALGALGDFADLKLPERTGYSRRVADLVSAAAEIAGLDQADRETAVRAALVHDIGVVAVPANVWRQSPTEPSAAWEQVRLHPYWGQRALSRCPPLEAMATVVGRHHERTDASGYPAGLEGDLGRPAGLLASAVAFVELMSRPDDRPENGVVAVAMKDLAASGALDRDDVAAVLGAAGARAPLVEIPRPAGLTEREVDVLCLLARGHTNREVAEELGISVKTVGSHVEHIYTKAGVRSRAAATLFAMQHDLVR